MCVCVLYIFFKASQPRGRASGSRAYERHEMQRVILKCTRHECSVFVQRVALLISSFFLKVHACAVK